MYIETDQDHVSRLRIEDDGEVYIADFNDDGVARVTQEAGEAFVDEYDSVEVKEREDNTSENEDNEN
jgi:hypothetical protein